MNELQHSHSFLSFVVEIMIQILHQDFTDISVCSVKNVTRVFSYRFDGSLVENETKSAQEIPSFSSQTPRKFHDPNLSEIHVMFQHGKQIKPGQMTWNSHGIWCGFGPNRHQVEL